MKTFRQVFIVPALVVGTAALLLYGFSRLPPYLPGSAPAAKEYISIEEASTDLGFDIAMPVFFPNYLAWPPETIKGIKKPFPMAEIVIMSAGRKADVLTIYEWRSDNPDPVTPLDGLESISARMPVDIGQAQGELIIGKKADGSASYSLSWKDDTRSYLLITSLPIQELLTIARSIAP